MVIVYAPTRSVTERSPGRLAQAGHRAVALPRGPVAGAARPHARGVSRRPAGRHRRHLRLRHGHRQAADPAGRALDAAGHPGGLLSGGRPGRPGRRVRALRAAVAGGRRRAPPPPARRHLPAATAARAHLARGRGLYRHPGQRACLRGAAPARAPARAGAGRLVGRAASGAGGRRGASRPWRRTRGGARCRRETLVGYFGERLDRCSGCDRCRRRAVPAAARSRRRARASPGCARRCRGTRGPWGAALLEPEVLLALARDPPPDAAALADVPGVGAALAERWGKAILDALESARRGHPLARARAASRSRPGVGVPRAGPAFRSTSCYGTRRSTRWWPRTARCARAGPRARPGPARAGEARRRAARADRGDTVRRLSRPWIRAMPRSWIASKPANACSAGLRRGGARRIFEALVKQLRELRDRGLVDMPERSVAYATDEDAGAYVMAGRATSRKRAARR